MVPSKSFVFCLAVAGTDVLSVGSTCPGTIHEKTCLQQSGMLDTLDTDDISACCAACQNRSDCVAWSVNTGQKQCHLRSEWVPNDGNACTSGQVIRPGTCPAEVTIQEGMCLEEASLLTTLDTADIGSCCSACVDRSDCMAWNVNTKQGTCHLRAEFKPNSGAQCTAAQVREPPTPPKGALNVLYIVVDDLRPQILAYNNTDPAQVPTPNLDRLVRSSAVFTKAYVQIAVCSPSRNSFTTGRRPQHTKVWNFQNDFRQTNKSWLTVPQWFKDRVGYTTNGNGKYFHPGHPANQDFPYSWSTQAQGGWEPDDPDHQINICTERGLGKPINCEIDEDDTVDKYLANLTHTRLTQLNATGKPWFLVVGHLKPHPFWGLPKSAFDMFPVDDTPLPQTNLTFTENMFHDFEPSYYSCEAINSRDELTSASLHVWPYTPLPDAIIRKIRASYFAGIVHTDKMIGSTLDKLEELGMADNTIIVFHADNGWELGERGSYCKMGCDELRTRVPFAIHDPSRPQSHGTVHRDPTELLNVFPTIVELATGQKLDYDVDGVSLAKLFDNPGSDMPPPKGFSEPLAFSVYPRCLNNPMDVSPYGYNVTMNPCNGVPREEFSHIGLAIRSQNHRYIEWRVWDGAKLQPRFDIDPVSVELYDHHGDDGTSMDAIANFEYHTYHEDAAYADVVAEHAAFARQMWDNTHGNSLLV